MAFSATTRTAEILAKFGWGNVRAIATEDEAGDWHWASEYPPLAAYLNGYLANRDDATPSYHPDDFALMVESAARNIGARVITISTAPSADPARVY